MFSLVLPFHRDSRILEGTLERIERERSRWPIGQILLAHNGPVLPTEVWVELQKRAGRAGAALLHTDVKGMGGGYRIGISEAREPWIVLSASDLPFGFSDLESFLALTNKPSLAVGSKGHPHSNIGQHPWSRRLSSQLFYFFRRALLGRGTPRDSQGTLIVERTVAQSLLPDLLFDDYSVSLELIMLVLKSGGSVKEIPVILEERAGDSSVSLIADGYKMARRTMELRRRLRHWTPRAARRA